MYPEFREGSSVILSTPRVTPLLFLTCMGISEGV